MLIFINNLLNPPKKMATYTSIHNVHEIISVTVEGYELALSGEITNVSFPNGEGTQPVYTITVQIPATTKEVLKGLDG